MPPLGHVRRGSGPPLVLVHGYLGGSAMWRGQIKRFAPYFDVIAPDLPGFGESRDLPPHDSIDALAAHVLAFLSDLGVERFALLGHSMGGMVVQQMAADAPDRIAKLVCYGTGPVGVLPGRFETIEQSRARLARDGVAATARMIAATWFRAGEDGPGFDICEKLGKHVSMETALASLTAWERWDGRPGLARIAAETLVLWGDRDRSYDWSQPEALWRGIERAGLAVIPGCAHNVHMEKPDLFDAVLADFLAGEPTTTS